MKIKYLLLLILIYPISSWANALNGDVRGTVIDKITMEPLPGVNIIVLGTDFGAATNLEGEFILSDLSPGTYQVKASFVGYESVIKSDVVVNSARPVYLIFELSESVIELGGITVTSDFFSSEPTEVNSVKSFSYEEIRRAPGGFEDVIRALSVLPGISQTSPGRNDLIVRGGAPSENLFIVDGFVIPNINHFGSQGATGGPLSYINLDFVNETTFSSGGFSGKYGDKLSSVLNISLREGRSDRIGGKALISASQFGLNLEGPISDNGNFLFSVRRSYLDFIFNAAGFSFVPEYYDVITKMVYDFDIHNKVSFLFTGAFDRVKFNNDDKEDIYKNAQILDNDQNQYLAGLSFRHLFGDGFWKVSLSRNFVDYKYSQKDTSQTPIFSNISVEAENELKTDLVYKLSSSSELNIGASAKLIEFETDIVFPENFITTFGEVLPVRNINADEYYTKFSLYSQFSSMLFHRLRLNAGLRLDYFNEINNGFYISPRFSSAYMLTENSSINFSAGVYYQFPSYIWLVGEESNKDLDAIQVLQFIGGYEHKLKDDISLKIEGFYKSYSDYPASSIRKYLVLANTGANFAGASQNFDSFGLEPLIGSGKGNVKGLEFSLQKKSSDTPLYGIFSLTYSKAEFQGADAITRPGKFDQRWIINLSSGYIFNEKWEAAVKFRYSTGSPYTPFNNDGSQSIDNYLSERFTPSHSLDVRIDRRWDFDGWNMITYIDVQNIYNRNNITNNRWDYYENRVEEASSIGILPSIGISIEF